MNTGRWANDEHTRYVEGLKRFGLDFPKLSRFIQTRKTAQVRYYHNKQIEKLKQEKARLKAASATLTSASQAKKRSIEEDGAATEAKKKVKVATEEVTASSSSSPPMAAKPVKTDDMLAVSRPELTPTLVPTSNPSTEVEQKPAAIPLPEIDEIPVAMKPQTKLAPKRNKVDDVDDNVHEDRTNEFPKTSEETKKEEEIDIGVGGGNVLEPVAGGGCPLKLINSLLEKEYVQCILGFGWGEGVEGAKKTPGFWCLAETRNV